MAIHELVNDSFCDVVFAILSIRVMENSFAKSLFLSLSLLCFVKLLQVLKI